MVDWIHAYGTEQYEGILNANPKKSFLGWLNTNEET
jgi:hypothetical protein